MIVFFVKLNLTVVSMQKLSLAVPTIPQIATSVTRAPIPIALNSKVESSSIILSEPLISPSNMDHVDRIKSSSPII